MISNEDKNILLEMAKRYNVKKLYLLDSIVNSSIKPDDIALAVEGIEGIKFYKFYSELNLTLSKPVDLIDLQKKSIFTENVKSEGILLYG